VMGNARLAGEMFPCCKLDVASDPARKWRCRLDATWTILAMSKRFFKKTVIAYRPNQRKKDKFCGIH